MEKPAPQIRLPFEFIEWGYAAKAGKALKMYLVLLSHADKHGGCYPGTKRLQAECGGVSEATISRHRKKLKDLGYILRMVLGGGTTSIRYTIAFPVGIMSPSRPPPTEEAPNRLHLLKTMPYSEYLETDHWKAQRKRALGFANHRCQTCNSETSLDVHHRTYERRGEEHLKDLIALCKSCHQKFHDILPDAGV